MHNNNHKRQETQIILLEETIKDKNPQISSEIEWELATKVKLDNIKMISDS